MDDEIRLVRTQPGADGDRVAKIELVTARREKRGGPLPFQPFTNKAAEKSASARQQDAALVPETHARVLRCASSAASSRSESTIRSTSSSNEVAGVHPSFSFAFDASPSSRSTSVGRK